MDNTAAQVKIQNEICKVQEPADTSLIKESVCSSVKKDHSPARSSIKSFQTGHSANASANANTKSIPKYGGNKLKKPVSNPETKSKSSKTSISTNEIKKVPASVPAKKNTSPVLNGETTSKTNTPNGKSKIPAMKRSPNLNNTQQKNRATSLQNSQPLKGVTGKSRDLKNPSSLKPPPVPISKSNVSLLKTAKLESDKMSSSISRSSFVTSNSVPIQVKIVPKSQSARSSSGSPNSTKNKRSVSNVSKRSTHCSKKKDEFETNLREMSSTAGDQNKIETLVKKLETAQTEYLKEIQNLKETSPDKYNIEHKFVALIMNDESKLIVKEGELRQLPKKFPAVSVNDFKEKLKNYMDDWFSSIKDDLKDSKDTDNADIEKVKEKLEQLQILKSHGILSFVDDFCAETDVNTELNITKLKEELEESNKVLKKSEKTLNDLTKQHEEHILNIEKEFKIRADIELNKKEEELKELQKKLKSQEKQINLLKTCIQNTEKEYETEKAKLNEELQTNRDCITTINKKLQSTEQQFIQEKKQLRLKSETIKRLESELAEKEKLANTLSEMTTKTEELQAKLNVKDKPCKECVENLKQIGDLKIKVEALESDKTVAKQRMVELEKALIDQVKLQDKLKEAKLKLQDYEKQLEENEKSLELNPECTKEVQLEFAKLRQSETEKRREIEKLKGELSKYQFNMCQLEQQIQRDQQLLDVRSELINSLQTNEKNHRIHMEELFAQVSEKNNTINELNTELQNKSEEFRNIFTTLSAKQMELANQEHIIKLLEESNERSQMLRVKQEEKIARMEEELSHLKQTISIYQANILTGNGGKQLLFSPVLPPNGTDDYNQNFYYYASQRKRKRHVDINVKKYEA